MRKIGLFALMTTLVSLGAFADTVVTSKTYVDAKVQAQGSTTGSILSASSPDDKAPSSKAVYTALQGIDGATPYTGTGLISVNDHEISTTAEQNVQADWDEATATSDAYIANKPTIVNAATDITGATSADTKELPTTYAVQQYVTTAAAASNFVEDSITDGVTTKAPSENAVHDALALKYDASNPSGYQANVLEGVQIAGVDQTITSKKVNLGAAAGKAVDSTSTDVPTTAAVAAYVANQPGATAYTGGNLITVNDHEISTTAQVNVLEGVQVNGSDLTIDANKKVNLGAAAGKAVETAISSTAANNTDAEVPTAKAVYDYVNPIQTAVTALQSCTHTCTSSDPTNAPNACDLITINCVETGA